ncbi:MAG TPA: hypothetical protein VHD32_17105 [Candidatus Didemnitutus sp.]|nr:hypothetical protein [Candidatus Didemnitutus sp.]
MSSRRDPLDFDRAAKRVPRHHWIWAPLENDPTFVLRSMFGSKAVYLQGRILFAFCEGEEPWRGVLVATDRAHHDSLRREVRGLTTHSILGKWLYLPEESDAFESSARQLVRLVQARDPRIGVLPKPRKRKLSRSRNPSSRP